MKIQITGGGGFVLFVAPPEKHAAIRAAMPDKFALEVRVNCSGAEIVFDGGAQ